MADAICSRSWIEFNPQLLAKLSKPVLLDEKYVQAVHTVKSLLEPQLYPQDDDQAYIR